MFTDDDGKVSINVCFADEDVWLTQEQLAQIYATTQQNVSQHVKCIYADGELSDEATHKKFLLVRQEGSRQVKREIDHYNLDMIIALGYRVQSPLNGGCQREVCTGIAYENSVFPGSYSEVVECGVVVTECLVVEDDGYAIILKSLSTTKVHFFSDFKVFAYFFFLLCRSFDSLLLLSFAKLQTYFS